MSREERVLGLAKKINDLLLQELDLNDPDSIEIAASSLVSQLGHIIKNGWKREDAIPIVNHYYSEIRGHVGDHKCLN
jgi:hypothetical protein